MAKKKVLMVNLEDTQDVAQVLSNKTSRKILDYLAEKEATESELAEKLSVPISTIHYNLEQLRKAKLVIAEEFHYSKRGKEINHYKLANQYIIIAPKNTPSIKQKLSSLIPALIGVFIGSGLIHLFTKESSVLAAPMTKDMVAESTGAMLRTVPEPIMQSQPQYALWFLFGGIIVIAIIFIAELIMYKLKQK
jgi:DNA-binding transcriptional ArsR family regulator